VNHFFLDAPRTLR